MAQQRNKILILILYSFFTLQITAQLVPPIQNFDVKSKGAENQNWSISQASNNFIYVANNKGLLEYNGADWKLYPTPNETIMRSVKASKTKIYTGCYMDFGFWKPNEFGILEYTSLLQKLEIPKIEDEQFWNILQVHDWIIFQSLNRLVLYKVTTEAVRIIPVKNRLTKAFKVDNKIYFQEMHKGIYTIENGSAKLVTNHPIVTSNEIVAIFKESNSLLLQTQEKGMYTFSNGTLQTVSSFANAELLNTSIYSSLQLKNGSFIFGTIANGMLNVNKNGKINYKINSKNGLANNTVLCVFEDIDSNIWLGLDTGISCINSSSPFQVYAGKNDKLGTVYASVLHNDTLYLGTNQGLFFKNINEASDFRFISGTKGQVWCLKVIENTLFCGHNNGTYIVENSTANLISAVLGTWNIIEVPNSTSILLQGNYDGLHVLEKTRNRWKYRNKLENFNISSRYFEAVNPKNIIVNHEYKGVFKLELDSNYTKVMRAIKDTSLQKAANSSLIKYNNEILYAFKNGIYKYNTDKHRFYKDSIYSTLFSNDDYISGKLVVDAKNKLWSFTNKELRYLSLGNLSNTPKINTIALPNVLRKSMTGYENITNLKGENYLFGTTKGFMLIDIDKISNSKEKEIQINTIQNNRRNQKATFITKNSETQTFPKEANNFSFSYGIASFNKYSVCEYQYKLEGFSATWSSWSTNTNVAFTNLPAGEYTFKVKGKIGSTILQKTDTFTFKIAKPWHATTVMVIIYVLLFLLFSFVLHTVYKQYYKKQREKLLKNTKQELELKKLENEQQLMTFKNEKLQQDIESKNRELATSTMSLIRKNEFLNKIKNELLTINSNNLQPVIRIIDDNINNTDDWKFFQEAFNNADKKFLKKIKKLHPTLTPNDLRLCAYLRLNLSSKEIAPLLNISSRSVEVKRYRLRKKMDLPHKKSLTSYILEL